MAEAIHSILTNGWSVTLDWRDILNILLAAVALIQFLRERKIKQACEDVLRRQAKQTAAHGFTEMARTAYDLETWAGKDEWDRSRDLAKRLIVSLAEGIGSWSEILESSEKDNAEAARSEIMSVERSIPGQAPYVASAELKEEMRNRCITAATLLAGIAGKLKRPEEIAKIKKQEAKAK